MSYEAIFNGWRSLTLSDLVVAYRKSKADAHFESILPTAVKFAEHEQDLLDNLNNLLAKLHSEQGFSEYNDLMSEFRVIGDFPVDAHILSFIMDNIYSRPG